MVRGGRGEEIESERERERENEKTKMMVGPVVGHTTELVAGANGAP